MRQAVVEPASAVNEYDGAWFCESPVGPAVIVGAAGALRSSAKVSLASVEMFPAGSLERTRKV